MRLSAITIFPIKSCAGIDLDSVVVDRFGPAGDRRWMVVADSGRFITQRDLPAMSQIGVSLSEQGICLTRPGPPLDVPVPDPGAPPRLVRVWEDRVPAQDAGDAAAAWLRECLATPCRLVYMPDDAQRRVDGIYAREGETVSFADGFPLLLISEASLEDLNARLPAPVPMNRFRPNLVVSGCEPFAEDDWRRIRIGSLEFEVAKPCSRCVMPSIVQETGDRDPHINRTLASFRRREGQIYFGQNLLYRKMGQLAVGDTVEVLD
jgi:uncharacterized protein YcbX